MPGFTASLAPSRPRGDIRLLGGGGGCGFPAPAPLLRALPHRSSRPAPPNLPLPLSRTPSIPPHSGAPPPRCGSPGVPGALAGPAAERGGGDAAALPMGGRRRAPPSRHSASPGPERMFEGSRRARSLWGGVRLEVAGESSPVVLHSFTQLDPDLPPLEVSAGRWGVVGGVTAAVSLGGSALCTERIPSLVWDLPPARSWPGVW